MVCIGFVRCLQHR